MKYKIISISLELLMDKIKGCSEMDTFTSNLPEDAHIVRVLPHHYNDIINNVKFIVGSDKFEDVFEGNVIPEFDVVCTDTYDPYENWGENI